MRINPIPHPYADETDLRAMQELLVRVRPAAWATDYPAADDLRELLADPLVQRQTRLWRDAHGRLIAFALVDTFNNLWFALPPESLSPTDAAGQQVMAWGAACSQQAMSHPLEPTALDTACRAEDSRQVAFLESHGFAQQMVRTLRLARSLADPIPEPRLPPGFHIRVVNGECEAAALVALHRAAFGTEHLTLANRLAWMRGPDYDPQLDLVAIAPDDRLAAYCFCIIPRQKNALTDPSEGHTDPIATHPTYRRMGLGRALLLTGMRLLRTRGVKTAVLGTSSENVAMQRVAESVGFQVESERVWFSKTLTP